MGILRSLCLTIAAFHGLYACKTPIPIQTEPMGRSFPSIQGKSPDGKWLGLPEDLPRRPCILVVGFVKRSEFDAARWLAGLDQLDLNDCLYEIMAFQGRKMSTIPKIPGQDMKMTLSKDLAKRVITSRKGSQKMVKFMGNHSPHNARVLLLDKEGTVRFFNAHGYSVEAILQLEDHVARLSKLEE